jgi:hypothetical protein
MSRPMDMLVRQVSTFKWTLDDLLGRAAGLIELDIRGTYSIKLAGPASPMMQHLSPGPYASLDAALSEIERHTHGTCMLRYDN